MVGAISDRGREMRLRRAVELFGALREQHEQIAQVRLVRGVT